MTRVSLVFNQRDENAVHLCELCVLCGKTWPQCFFRGPVRPAKRIFATVLIAAMTWAQATPALAYLKFGVRAGNREVTLKWNRTPVRYFVTERSAPGVSVQ